MSDIDATDKRILGLLQNDGRMTNADLADKINLSPSACLRRVQRLEEANFIDGYVMLVNQEAIGRPTNVFVQITLTHEREDMLDAFEKAVADCPDVMECFLMSGDSDYLLRVAVKGARDYERVHRQHLTRFPGVSRVRSNFSLRTVCKRTAYEIE